MAKPAHIGSYAEFEKTLSANTVVVVDFYADWCGPCKAIAPTFDALCASESKPGKVAFVKVDVDRQQEISKQYGVTAMPTFLIFYKKAVRDTVRGANQMALRSAINTAVAAAGRDSFTTGGRTLGADGAAASSSSSSSSAAASVAGKARSLGAQMPSSEQWAERIPSGYLGTLTRFVGLYFTTLLTLDPAESAASSPFRANTSRRVR